MSSTTLSAPDLAATAERNQEIWRTCAKLLYAGRIEEFLGYWREDARYEVAYPIAGMPAVVEGREALGAVFAGFGAAAERIEAHDVRFHQTIDPDVAFVQERMVADLVGGGRYENLLVIRVTFRDGLIADMLEYYGERRHEELLRTLGFAA
jgi:ketosteroid isomerase-like protein